MKLIVALIIAATLAGCTYRDAQDNCVRVHFAGTEPPASCE
jgi:hypothetical protein